MVYTKTTTRPKRKYNKYKKRSYIRKYKRYSKIPTAPSFNARLLKLKYADQKVYTSTSGAISSNIYSCNDLFDPDVTGVGGQPLFRDQMYALYARGRVISFSIKVTCTSNSAVPFKIVLYPAQSGASDTNLELAQVRPGAISRLYNPNGPPIYLKKYLSVDRYFGFPKGTVLMDQSYAQLSGASLLTDLRAFMGLSIQALGSQTGSMNVSTEICMYTRFEQPLQQSAS